MKERILSFLLFCVMFILQSCAHFYPGSVSKTEQHLAAVSQKLGLNSLQSFNADKTYVLIYMQAKATAENPAPFLHFVVYDIENDELLFEDNIPAGSVKWKNDFQIEVSIIPGNVSTENIDKQYGYIFDVKSKKRIELINTNQQIINQ